MNVYTSSAAIQFLFLVQKIVPSQFACENTDENFFPRFFFLFRTAEYAIYRNSITPLKFAIEEFIWNEHFENRNALVAQIIICIKKKYIYKKSERTK